MEDFDALEAQFSGLEQDRVLQSTRQQAEIAAAFYQKLRAEGMGKVGAIVITASMTQAFIVATLMKPGS